MAISRAPLPQLNGCDFLTDSGLETTLVFLEDRPLPAFAAFPLLDHDEGRRWLKAYYDRHLQIAADSGVGFIIETPTWRSNPDWGTELGYDAVALDRINMDAVALCREVRAEWAGRADPILLSGQIGPRGDGYQAGRMSSGEAAAYHRPQIAAFAQAGADLVTAFTLSTIEEAAGITAAARAAGIPVAISFTVETDGRLASGPDLGHAIIEVDRLTGGGPDYFMVNCAHPAHFRHRLDGNPAWAARIRGIRANASMQSHAELDNATILDDGDPADLGARYRDLRTLLPNLSVLGGCCGTDHRHVAAIAAACLTPAG